MVPNLEDAAAGVANDNARVFGVALGAVRFVDRHLEATALVVAKALLFVVNGDDAGDVPGIAGQLNRAAQMELIYSSEPCGQVIDRS